MNDTSWTATVEWHHDPYDGPELGQILDALADHAPAIGRIVSPSSGLTDLWAATLTLDATTLRAAIAAAVRLVEDATGDRALGVEVLPTVEHDRRVLEPSIPPLVGYAEIADIAGVTRQRARQYAEIAGFPPAVVTTQSGPLRTRASVEQWLASRDRKVGRPRTKV